MDAVKKGAMYMKLNVTTKGKTEAVHEARSRRGRNSRAKGATFERTVAEKFQERYGVGLVRTPMSGGFAKSKDKSEGFKGDIVPVDKNVSLKVHCECKDAKTWSLPAWFKQAESDCPKGKVPLVIFHKNNSSQDYVALSIEGFFSLVSSIVERGKK